ncbi:bifunctional N(6)-L-threonylcarbamoyladenine synthase/serine/threonine protein kinase [Candidatus Woesearchaeota archaeon]|nr:bifunctional N(6)-L-threonylcarbamoyladenine synthase/serine/threonine protein kinase [Candidatus Woesearchaeota archaeon]
MICLGIESTAHTFGIGIVDDKGNILANEKDSYTTESGGMIPSEASEHHVEACDKVLANALNKAKIKLQHVDLISFSQSPGLGQALRIGAFFSRSLASQLGKPIVGVNHAIAHLEIGRLRTKAKDPILLYASGANTQVIAYHNRKYRVFGETLDIGVGNFLDSFARHLGLGFPGGPKIYELSLHGKKYIPIPYVVKGMDVSFGGILTNVTRKYDSGKFSKEDLAYSIQETVFAMLVEVSERALAHTRKNELVLGGGVACNLRLKEMAKKMCGDRNAKCYIPENEFLVDNGAMIAWLGILKFKSSGPQKIEECIIKPYERTDDVDVTWYG